jgi:hypothetical protein
MSSRILGFSGVFAILLTTCALAGSYATPASSYSAAARQHRQAGSRLPKELKMVWKKEEHARLKAMPKDQRKGWLKGQWARMSDQQKRVKMAELQKKWDSLPQSVRQAMLERQQQKREARRMQRDQGGASSRGASGQMQRQ